MKSLLAAGMPLLVAACAPLPELTSRSGLAEPTDISAPVSVTQAGPSVNYTARAITEPGDWQTMNYEQVGEAHE